MYWTGEKLANRIKELEPYRYREKIPIETFKFKVDKTGEIRSDPPASGEWSTMRIGEYWSGRDLNAWLQTEIAIPQSWQSRSIVGIFDFGNTGGGNNSGFESLIYVNGSPYQGVDSNHREVFFPSHYADTIIQLTFRLWSGLEGGGQPTPQEHKLRRAELAWLDVVTDDLYFTAKAVLDTVQVLNAQQPERQLLLTALNRAFMELDWARPGTTKFYKSVHRARNSIHRALRQMKKDHLVTVRAIGHTHIDVAWLWRLKHTREKAARSFSTVLRLMEMYPEYIFLQTQPQLYEYLKSDFPEIYEQICTRVQEGRWEAAGGMWLEADCNIPSGESLVRQLLMGTRFLREEFGVECSYLWLPDVFGYSWALPQILHKSGINTFMTTKISWNQYNRLPHDTFKWRGIDGTEVLTHFMTTMEADKESSRYTYNGQISPATIKGSWDAYRDKAINQEILLSFGYGDGGGGVNRDMLEFRRRLNDMPGLPHIETGRVDDFFRRLQAKTKQTDQYVHTWDGELYLEYHRGTYTSQAYNKRMNRKLELLYRETEWLNVLRSVLTQDWANYPKDALNDGWKIILRNQFHDIIPGSSIREVYEDSRQEYAEAERLASNLNDRARASIFSTEKEHTFTVMNSASWLRSGVVSIPIKAGMEQGEWRDAQGEKLKASRSGGNWMVKVDRIPSMGVKAIKFEPSGGKMKEEIPFDVGRSALVTPYYKLEWNERGQLTKIYDRIAEREVLERGSTGNILQVFEDKPLNFDAWDIDIYYQEKMREVNDLKKAKVIEVNSLRTVVFFEWAYMDSTIKQQMIVYADSPRIDFVTHVDWHEQQQLLKVAFPVDVRSTEATYDIQFGNVKRPTHWNTSWDYARFETVGHQWADLSERGYGVSILNDCKYGHDIKDNVIRLSLIKSATHPDYLQDQGEHEFTYALLPHRNDWVEGNTVREAWELNHPLNYSDGWTSQLQFSLFCLSVDHVLIDTVKKAEDSNKIVLRMHEFIGRRGYVKIESELDIRSWQACDLMERPIGKIFNAKSIQCHMKPYEIKTFLVEVTPSMSS